MHFKSIQFLRGFSAIYIVLYHVIYAWGKAGNTFTGIFNNGYGAIDLFFVISGFVVFQSLSKFNKGFTGSLHFLVLRFFRVYAFYWTILFVFLLSGLIAFNNLNALQIVKTILLFPSHANVIVTSWTLPYEIYFYILLALYIVDKRFMYLLVLIFILSFVAFIKAAFNNQIELLPVYGFYNEFVFEFFLGILATTIYKKISKTVSLIFLVTGAVLFFLLPIQKLTSHVLMFGLPSVLIITGLVHMEMKRMISFHSIFVLLGDASFIIYLVHGPFISKALFLLEKNSFLTRFAILTIVAITIILSYAIHYYFEKPVLGMIKKLVTNTERLSVNYSSNKDGRSDIS